MRLKPNIYPTIELMKDTPPEDRLECVIQWIDFTIRDFEIHEQHMTGSQLLNYFKNCKKHWNKLVTRDFLVLDEGEEWSISEDMYPSVFAQRVMSLPMDEVRLDNLRTALLEIYEFFGWDISSLEEI